MSHHNPPGFSSQAARGLIGTGAIIDTDPGKGRRLYLIINSDEGKASAI